MEIVGITLKSFGHEGKERIRASVRGDPDFRPQIATPKQVCHGR